MTTTSPVSAPQYRIHTIASAPETAKDALRALEHGFGFIPNTAAIMAESPTLLSGFVSVFKTFHGGTFTSAERQTLLLSNAVANASAWAVAFRTPRTPSERPGFP